MCACLPACACACARACVFVGGRVRPYVLTSGVSYTITCIFVLNNLYTRNAFFECVCYPSNAMSCSLVLVSMFFILFQYCGAMLLLLLFSSLSV